MRTQSAVQQHKAQKETRHSSKTTSPYSSSSRGERVMKMKMKMMMKGLRRSSGSEQRLKGDKKEEDPEPEP